MHDNSSEPWATKACFFTCLAIFLGTIVLMFVPFRDMNLATEVFSKVYIGVHGILGGLSGMSSTIDAFGTEDAPCQNE